MSLDDTLQDLADRAGKTLVVLDIDLRVMAVSVHDTDMARARLSLLRSGKETPLTDKMVETHGLRTARRPIRIPGGTDRDDRIVVPLRHDDRLLGYLNYVEDAGQSGRAIPEDVMNGAAELGLLLSLRLSDLHRRMEHSRHLLTGLLGESPSDRSQCAFRLLDDGLIENVDRYSVLVFRTSGTGPIAATRLAVEATMSFTDRWTTVKIVGGIVGSEGILLFPRPVNRNRLHAVMDRPGVEDVRAGVGSVKGSLVQAVDSYREARLAWEGTCLDPTRYGRAAFWDDLGADRLLLQLPLATLTPGHFPLGVERLLESPQGRKLAGTLQAYLDAGGQVNTTAQRLDIHRSTLYYRLDRIRELTGCDISSGAVRMDLQIGIRVARLAGMLPPDRDPAPPPPA